MFFEDRGFKIMKQSLSNFKILLILPIVKYSLRLSFSSPTLILTTPPKKKFLSVIKFENSLIEKHNLKKKWKHRIKYVPNYQKKKHRNRLEEKNNEKDKKMSFYKDITLLFPKPLSTQLLSKYFVLPNNQ